MNLTGVHLLLTYRCDMECDHCFVWGSPSTTGVMLLKNISSLLREARKLGTVKGISIEGGEPFLYYPIMIRALREATKLGFPVEILSNCYWATSAEDAVEWLLPMAKTGDVELTLSSDLYHGETWEIEQVKNAVNAAKKLGIRTEILSVKFPHECAPCPTELEGAKVGVWELMYKGRAASELVKTASKKPWSEFTKCPYEPLENPNRVHVDPLGHVHVCQGISIGNAWRQPFSEIINRYNPFAHPVIGPLIQGGPVALAEKYNLPHDESYADACHFCYNIRVALRNWFPETLAPKQMYGEGLK